MVLAHREARKAVNSNSGLKDGRPAISLTGELCNQV